MSIRDITVTLIVLSLVPMAVQHPYIGVLLWTWISTMNPHKLAWGFATDMPFAAIAAAATFAGLLFTKDRVEFPKNRIVFALIAFVAFVTLTTMFAIDRADSLTQLNKVFKIQLMTVVAMAVLHERRHLQLFLWVNVLSLGFFGAKGGLFTLLTGGGSRVWGPPGGFIEGNNELALALVMTIPLMYYLRLTAVKSWLRNALLVLMLLTAVSVLGSHSRGALLAIVGMAVFLWWRSPNKSLAFVPMLAVAIAMFLFMPANWLARMETIQSYQSDGSAMGRINAWWTMFHVANDRLLGAGFSAYSAHVFSMYAPDPADIHAAHSIYFQVLGEHGWPGLALFLLVWILGWKLATRIRRVAITQAGKPGSLYLLAGMCQVSLVGYAVGGAFLSLAYFDLPYNILVMLVVAWRLIAQEETDPAKMPASPAVEAGRLGIFQSRNAIAKAKAR